MDLDRDSAIGVFDSGVGGLSVLRAIRTQMPDESTLYVADQGHVPYGPRSLAQVRDFSVGITEFLLERGVKLIVVACNSASAAALKHLRASFPHVSFVGMEPAVKPAAETTETGAVGVLATPATFQGALFASVIERFAAGVVVMRSTCPGLVERIEAGDLDGPQTRAILRAALSPMQERNIDTVVLACTHFPFVIPAIRELVGAKVRVIDPAPAIARRAAHLLDSAGLRRLGSQGSTMEFFTSRRPEALGSLLPRLLGEHATVKALTWLDDRKVVEAATSATRQANGAGS
jgi:glutamate racemase